MIKSTLISLLWGYNPGGVTEYVKNISKIKDSSKLHIKTIIIQRKSWGNDFSAFAKTDFEVIYFNNIFSFVWLIKLFKLLKKESPSFLYAHSFNSAIIAAIVKVFSRLKFFLVCSYHGMYFAPSSNRKILAPIYNRLTFFIYSKISKGVICVSCFSKKELVAKGVNQNKITVIHNGITLDPIISNKQIYEKKKGELLIGVVCRLVPLKGVQVLIEAIREISCVKLLIIGEGPMKKELMNKAKGISHKIAFVGNQDNVSDWLNALDIFVLPTFAENHSISILEAMRQAKAIITTDVGGNSESIRNGIDGLLVTAGNISELKEAILYFQNNKNKIKELGANAKERFKLNFTEIKMNKNTIKYFENYLQD